MAQLRVYKISDTKVQTVDECDRAVFTTVYDFHIIHDSVTTIYRGTEESGDVLARFKGSRVTYDGRERKQKEMVYSNSALGECRTFFTPIGPCKWKAYRKHWELVPVPKPRPSPPLLTYASADKEAKEASGNKFGHSLESILTLSPQAVSEKSEYGPFLVEGVPTPMFELALVILVIIMAREGGSGSSVMAAAVGGVAGGAAGGGAAAAG